MAKKQSIFDQRATKYLMDTFWEKGWKHNPTIPHGSSPPNPDLTHAIKAGLMFPPITLTRKQVIARLHKLASHIRPQDVGSAFAASLSRRVLAFRSALGSYAVTRFFPDHDCDAEQEDYCCRVCGESGIWATETYDFNSANFTRHKWGFVSYLNPPEAMFDLERFVAEASLRPPRTADDDAALCSILNTASAMSSGARIKNLESAIAGLMPSTRSERQELLEVLAYAGILQPKNKPNFRKGYVTFLQRNPLENDRSDWDYPACRWRGSDGVDAAAVREWFPWLRKTAKGWTPR